jgi:hypothetical protein
LYDWQSSLYAVVGGQRDSSEIYCASDRGSAGFVRQGSLPPGVREATGIGSYIIATAWPESTTLWSITRRNVETVNDSVYGLAIRSDDSLVVISGYTGLLFSSDTGRTWQRRDTSTRYSEHIAMHGDTIAMNGSLSTDRGYTWQSVSVPPEASATIEHVDGAWLQGNKAGLFASENCAEWRWAFHGIEAARIVDLALHDHSIFAVTFAGIMVSSDQGTSWYNSGGSFSALQEVNGTLYCLATDTLWKWSGRWSAVLDSTVYSIASVGSTLFASVYSPARGHGIIIRSTDNGASWTELAQEPSGSMTRGMILESCDSLLFACVGSWDQEKGLLLDLYVSTNAGLSWGHIDEISSWGYSQSYACFQASLYVGSDEGLRKSSDSGRTWQMIPGIGRILNLRPAPTQLLGITRDTTASYLIRVAPNGSFQRDLSGDSASSVHVVDADADYMIAGTVSRGVWIAPARTGGVERDTIVTTLSAYPNPADDYVRVDLHSPSDKALVQVFDCTGRCVSTPISLSNAMATIDTHALSSGVYSVTISVGERVEHTPFVKR